MIRAGLPLLLLAGAFTVLLADASRGQVNTTLGACSNIVTNNTAPVTNNCVVVTHNWVTSRNSEFPADLPATVARPGDEQGSSFRRLFSLPTYKMNYAEFRLAIGKVQLGLAKINGTDTARRSREQLIIGAEDDERGRLSVFNFDSGDLSQFMAQPSNDFFFSYSAPDAVVTSVEIAYNHKGGGHPNELTETGVRISSSSMGKMLEMSNVIREAFEPYQSRLASAFNYVTTGVLLLTLFVMIVPFVYAVIAVIALFAEPGKWKTHGTFLALFALQLLLFVNAGYRLITFPVIVPVGEDWTMLIAWASTIAVLIVCVPMFTAFIRFVEALND